MTQEHEPKTLRDEFAMAALAVSVDLVQSVSGSVDSEPVARCAYAIADAMMKVRRRTPDSAANP